MHTSVDRTTRLIVALLAMAGSLPLAAEEVLQPRGKEAYEAHLKELEAKYGVDKAALQATAKAAAVEPVVAAPEPEPAPENLEPVATQKVEAGASVAQVAEAHPTTITGNPADLLPAGARVRVALSALGTERFRFGGEALDAGALQTTLERMGKDYTLDALVLMETEGPIQARHLVTMSQLSAHFKVPALYQSGQTLLAVRASP